MSDLNVPSTASHGLRHAFAVAALTLAAALAMPAGAADNVDMAAAKSEGTLTWYTSTPQSQAEEIARMFEAGTGIKVRVFRSGGEDTMRRFMTEQSAKTVVADVITTSDSAAFNALAKAGKLVKFTPEHADKVPSSAKSKDGTWISQRLNLIVPAYRTDKVANPPKSYQDLADARFKGQSVMADPAFTSFSFLVVQNLSHKLGWDFFKRIAANDMMLVKGHAQVSQALLAGERSVALEADAGQLLKDIKKGAKVQLVIPSEGVFLINSPIAIPVGAPHPNAAKAFLAFNLGTDVQKLFIRDGTYSARTDVDAPPTFPALKDLNIIDVDYDAAERENKQVKNEFADIFH